MKPGDGGPAFPSIGIESEPDNTGNYHVYSYEDKNGMTLRDYFAAKAMNGYLVGIAMSAPWPAIESLAKKSYEVADALLTERDKSGREGQ